MYNQAVKIQSICIFSAKAVDINIQKGLIVMKKFLGVLVVVALCICMIVPAAMAKGTDLSSILDGVDIGSLTDGELASILKGLDLDGLDTDAIKNALGGDSSSASKIESALKNLGTDSGTGSDSTGSDALSGISGLLGGIDLSKISGLISDPSAITDMFGGLLGGGSDNGSGTSSSSGFDISSLMDTISGAFSGAGFDIGSLTEGFDMGSFDFSSILGGLTGGSDSSNPGQSSNGAMDVMSGIMDTLTSGLSGLGIDTSAIEGLLDNELVNFFANMYIGLGKVIKPDTETTTAPVTSKPAAVTKKNPKTGDTADVFVALGVLTVATAAAFVCLKKKKED